jgi:hypothetical protein
MEQTDILKPMTICQSAFERLEMIKEVSKLPNLPSGTFVTKQPLIPLVEDIFEYRNAGFGPAPVDVGPPPMYTGHSCCLCKNHIS